MELISRDQI